MGTDVRITRVTKTKRFFKEYESLRMNEWDDYRFKKNIPRSQNGTPKEKNAMTYRSVNNMS